MSEPNVSLVQEFLGKFLAGDLEAGLDHLAPDVVSHEPENVPYPGDHRGHEGIRELANRFDAVWEVQKDGGSLEVLPVGLARVLALMETNVKARSTGKRLRLKLAELYTVRDGTITDIRVFNWDTAAIMAALDGPGSL